MSEIRVDTISEKTSANGVSIDSVTLKDGGATLSDNLLFNASGKGVYLGTTTATASNLLDDYETGTWTPEFGGSTTNPTITYSINDGVYTKIGNMVTISGRIDVDTVSGGSGNLRLLGVPFTPDGDATLGKTYVLPVSRLRNFTSDISGSTGVAFVVFASDNISFYYTANTTGSSTNPSTSFLKAGSTITFSGTYQTTA